MSIGKILGLFGIIGAILMIICVFLAWGSCEITALGVTAKFDFSGWCLATGGDVTVTALGESETASISELGLKYAFAPYVVLACGIIGIIAAALPMFMDCNENINKGLGILALILAIISIVVTVLYVSNVGGTELGSYLKASVGAYLGIVGAILMIVYGLLSVTNKLDKIDASNEAEI